MRDYVKGCWTDDDMKTFPHLKEKDFEILLDLDCIDDWDSFLFAFSDAIYREFNIVVKNQKHLVMIFPDFYGIAEKIFP